MIDLEDVLSERYDAYSRRWPGDWRVQGAEYWVFDTETCITLLSDRRLTSHRARLSELAFRADEPELAMLFSNWLMYTDGQPHIQNRRSVIDRLKWSEPPPETGFPSFAHDVASALMPLSAIDVVDTLAKPWAASYVLGCCGLPMEAVATVERLASEIVRLPGLSYPTEEDVARASASYRSLCSVIREYRLIRGSVAEAILKVTGSSTNEQLAGALINIMIDGVHPTAAGLASAVVLLSGQPPENITPEHVASAIRMEAPFQYVARIALQPLEIHQKSIPAGARVVLCIGASARCPQNQERQQDLTFGHGRHRCIGEGVARQCIWKAFQLIREWAPQGYQIDGAVNWAPSVGYRALVAATIRRTLD